MKKIYARARKVEFKNITIKLIIANVILFMLQVMLDGFLKGGLTNLLVVNSNVILTEPWRLITSMFIHSTAGMGHLFFNMYALMLFGSLVERKIGSKRFLYLYLLSGIVAAIAFMIISPGQSALGASGAIMAIIGMTIMLFPNMQILLFFVIPMKMRTAGIIFAFIDIFGLFFETGIANSAHLGGLACGLLYGWYLLKKGKEYQKKFHKPVYKATRVKNASEVIIDMNDQDMDDYLKYGRI